MSNSTYFVQECPTCGRRLQIRVEYLGRSVVCQHCQGRLVARDPANTHQEHGELAKSLLHRAEELLESSARRETALRLPYPR
ncbi:MAG: response regulator [Pirellulales bacterium]|nr:response regulator [Pirellulales bacterium]